MHPPYPSGPMAAKKPSSNDGPDHPIADNRKARFHYEITETLEVGIMLRGHEVKSVRDGRVTLAEGYVRATLDPPELQLLNVNIEEYKHAGPLKTSTHRVRTLLAHKKEIVRLGLAMQVKGMTIVPLKLYFKNGYAKLLIGVGKDRKSHDKRQAITKRETQRDIQRAMSRRA